MININIAQQQHDFKLCKTLCVLPIISPFNTVPMGHNNNMTRNIPDLLHIFCGGIMKSVLMWVLIIIDCFRYTSDQAFLLSLGELYRRIRNFPKCSHLTHMVWRNFPDGLSFIILNHNKKEVCFIISRRI